jgi:hypothetical protein
LIVVTLAAAGMSAWATKEYLARRAARPPFKITGSYLERTTSRKQGDAYTIYVDVDTAKEIDCFECDIELFDAAGQKLPLMNSVRRVVCDNHGGLVGGIWYNGFSSEPWPPGRLAPVLAKCRVTRFAYHRPGREEWRPSKYAQVEFEARLARVVHCD